MSSNVVLFSATHLDGFASQLRNIIGEAIKAEYGPALAQVNAGRLLHDALQPCTSRSYGPNYDGPCEH